MILHMIWNIGDDDDLGDDDDNCDNDDDGDDDDDEGEVLCNGEFLRATKMWDVKYPATKVHCTRHNQHLIIIKSLSS